jgi:16S rRNA (cytidine1402-2'-O)-methyltransferase
MLSPFGSEIIQQTICYFAENLRTTRRFISSLKLGIDIESLRISELSKDTSIQDLKKALQELPAETEQIGLLSEAGCPGIADPGAILVALAHEMSWKVVPIPGPSSIFLALMASGFNGQNFTFHGYLPMKQDERIKAIKKLEEETMRNGGTQIFIETPYRNQHIFADMTASLKNDTLLCVASNITSADEMIKTKNIQWWKNNIPNIHKIPTIFLISNKK